MKREDKIYKIEYVVIEECLFVGFLIWTYETDNDWDLFQFYFSNPVKKEEEVIKKYECFLNSIEEKGRPVIFVRWNEGNLVGVMDEIDERNERDTDCVLLFFLEPVSDEKELINKGWFFLELLKKDIEETCIPVPINRPVPLNLFNPYKQKTFKRMDKTC